MEKQLKNKIIHTIKENSLNELLYVMVIGGQSYYTSKDDSDIDILAVTLPKLTEVTFSKNTSNVQTFYEIDNKVIDVKYTDLRTFFSHLSKGNSSALLEIANLHTDREFLLYEKDNNLTQSMLDILSNNMSKDYWNTFFKSIKGQIFNMKRNNSKLLTAKNISFVKMLIEFLDNYLDNDIFSNKFNDDTLQKLLDIKYDLDDSMLLNTLESVEEKLNSLVVKFESDDSFEYSIELLNNMEKELSLLLVTYIMNQEK